MAAFLWKMQSLVEEPRKAWWQLVVSFMRSEVWPLNNGTCTEGLCSAKTIEK